ncbi:hypothetical protein [Parasphingopyxis marina]|uniref:Lipoprotein n=1 Tax=Parasphingopyxis marina TaxID=2761622 RepID=A0A842HU68_9SPHN|nr:hypothetical protein [Parasphingopyxis marina]MBC2776475.1 hypothetical protein [Parasphingopyxis marina]
MMLRPLLALLAGTAGSFVALSACSAQVPSADAPEAESAPGWQDAPLAAGTWVYRQDDRGSVALFGEPESEAVFLVRCALAERRIYFSREGTLEGGGTMTISTTHGAKSYPAQGGTGALPYAVAAAEARDDFLDKMAFTRGRIAVSVNGMPLVAIPNWPEMIRVFEDCRA